MGYRDPRSAGQEDRGGGATRGRVRVAPAVSAATTTGHTAWARITTRSEMPYHVPSVVSCAVNHAMSTMRTAVAVTDAHRSRCSTRGENARASGQAVKAAHARPAVTMCTAE